MTSKYVLDESAHALHQVAGNAHLWEELAPGIRVRRRVIRAPPREQGSDLAPWVSTMGADFISFLPPS